MARAAVYHFTDKSTQRPGIYQAQLKALEEFAVSLGYPEVDIFCDFSLRKCDHKEFERFLSTAGSYEALITKDFYHISKNSEQCMKLMKDLRDKGVTIHTIENGTFTFEGEPLDEPLRVCTYTCRFGTPSELKEIIPVQNDILKLFARKKTAWTVIDQYTDESQYQRDGEQVQLKRLIDNKENYDLLLVHNLGDIHWRTANLCRVRETLQMDIYSLQDGLLKYRKGAA